MKGQDNLDTTITDDERGAHTDRGERCQSDDDGDDRQLGGGGRGNRDVGEGAGPAGNQGGTGHLPDEDDDDTGDSDEDLGVGGK